MKFSELETIMNNYDSAKWSPRRMDAHFGCDCGCGGDSYTEEEWNAAEDAADLSIITAKIFCTKYGIEYDGIE